LNKLQIRYIFLEVLLWEKMIIGLRGRDDGHSLRF
jgi:hypothetical protein